LPENPESEVVSNTEWQHNVRKFQT